MNAETVKLVEIIGGVVVQLSYTWLAVYAVRLSSDYLRFRLERTGKGVFERRTDADDIAEGVAKGLRDAQVPTATM